MEFETSDGAASVGREVGFFASYMVFFNVFYIIINFLGKMPFEVSHLDYVIMLLTVFVWGKLIARVIRHVKG